MSEKTPCEQCARGVNRSLTIEYGLKGSAVRVVKGIMEQKDILRLYANST